MLYFRLQFGQLQFMTSWLVSTTARSLMLLRRLWYIRRRLPSSNTHLVRFDCECETRTESKGSLVDIESVVCLMTSIALIVLSIQYKRGRWLCSIAGYDVTKRGGGLDIRPYAKRISSVTLWMGLLFLLLAVEGWARNCNASVFEVLVLLLFILAFLSFVRLVRFVFLRR